MKYSVEHPPIQCFQTMGRWYRETGVVPVKGVLIHSTAANNPYISRYVQPSDDAKDREEMLKLLGKNKYNNDWNHEQVGKGVHAFVGKLTDGTIASVQCGPWNKKAWGCGSGSRGSCNNGWIQFEICEDALNDAAYFKAVYQEAVELTAYLCKLHNLNPLGNVSYLGITVPVILCHADSYKLSLGSNHSDVLHWFPRFGKDMTSFRNDVASLLSDKVEVETPVPASPSIELPMSFHVKTNGLVIQANPSIDDRPIRPIEPGVFTITELRGNWGKLKSGLGWIWLGDGEKGEILTK